MPPPWGGLNRIEYPAQSAKPGGLTQTLEPGGFSALRRNLKQNHKKQDSKKRGGADRDRTGDPLLAKQVLSQLSYSPIPTQLAGRTDVVGLGRFELPTSPLSGVRSNQLSYRPFPIRDPAITRRASRTSFGDQVEHAGRLRRP
jgi:hypothetical protein